MEYVSVKGDTFGRILKRFLRFDVKIKNSTPMVIKTVHKNPHIKNWKSVEPKEKIILYINSRFMDKKKWEHYQKTVLGVNEQQDGKRGFRASIFYMASRGSFQQVSEEDGVSIDFEQNSNVSLGLSTTYALLNKRYSYSSSLYYSSLSATSTNIGTIEVPSEIGGNLYFQYPFKMLRGVSYAGIDYETFPTYNTEGLSRPKERTLIVNKNNVSYLTVGHSLLFNLMGKNIFTKFSLSKSITSSTTVQGSALAPEVNYAGIKLFTYLNYKITNKFFTHFIAKYHTMSGPDQLTVTRFGIGFGFILN